MDTSGEKGKPEIIPLNIITPEVVDMNKIQIINLNNFVFVDGGKIVPFNAKTNSDVNMTNQHLEVKQEIISPPHSPQREVLSTGNVVKEEDIKFENEAMDEEDYADFGIGIEDEDESDYNEEDEEEMFTNESELMNGPATSDEMIEIIKNEFGNKTICSEVTKNTVKQDDQAKKDMHAKCEKQLMKIIGSINSRICHICKKRFDTKEELKVHANKMHNSKIQKFICPLVECDKKFAEAIDLTIHISSMHIGHCYSCSICNMKSKAIQNISKHIRTSHAGQGGRPKDFDFELDHIPLDHIANEPEDYQTEADNMEDVPLNQRMEKSLKPKPMSREKIKLILQKALYFRYCNICKTFYQGLKVFVAHFEKEHKCQVPKKKFMCPELGCGKQYTHKETLQQHMKTVHFGFYYRCSICQKKLNHVANTAWHFKKCHPGLEGKTREFRKNPHRKEKE